MKKTITNATLLLLLIIGLPLTGMSKGNNFYSINHEWTVTDNKFSEKWNYSERLDQNPTQDDSGIKIGINNNTLPGMLINKLKKTKSTPKNTPENTTPKTSSNIPVDNTPIDPSSVNYAKISSSKNTKSNLVKSDIVIPQTSKFVLDTVPVPEFKAVTVPEFSSVESRSNNNPISAKFYIGLNNDALGFEDGTITGWIFDESPEEDILFIDKEINSTNRAIGLHFGFGSAGNRKKIWDLNGSFAFNDEGRMFLTDFGYGLRFGKSKFTVSTLGRIGFGIGSFNIGETERTNPNSEFIQIDETLLYHDEIRIRFKELFAFIGPELNVAFPISETSGIQLSSSFRLAANFSPRLKFIGVGASNNDESGSSEKRELGHSFNNILLDNILQDENSKLIDFGGLAFKVSYVKYY